MFLSKFYSIYQVLTLTRSRTLLSDMHSSLDKSRSGFYKLDRSPILVEILKLNLMKFFYLILILFLSQGAFAQSNYVSTYLENPVINAFELHSLPWDETRLYQYTRNNGSGYEVFTIDEVAFNALSPVIPPLCSEILEVPQIIDDGLLIVGSTASGKELLYFDEVNSTVFDLNPGAGDSDPLVYTMNDRVFIVAFNGTTEQLFEFDQVAHTISQITNSSIPVQSVCAVWGDDIFYRLKFEDVANGADDYHLMKATLNVSSYVHDTIQSISIPSTPNRMVDWRSPQLFQGFLYFMTVNVQINASTTSSFPVGLISVDANNQVSTSSLVLPISDGEFLIVQWDGKLGVYSDLHEFFYSSTDGLNFQSDLVPVDGRLVESHVSENDQLYFTWLDNTGLREILEFDGGFQSKFAGEHLHFLSEHDNILYYSDYIQFDSSSIVLVYSNIDVVDEVKVYFAFHPPIMNASTMFNGLFTFLFGSENGFADDNDILQLTGAPSAGMEDITVESSIYPNPISSGDELFLESNSDGTGKVLTSDGRMLTTIKIHPGTNRIDTSLLTSGVYFISFKNHTQRIVVN